MSTTLPETMDADEGLMWAYLYLESERGPWLEVGRTVGRNIALNGARPIASNLALSSYGPIMRAKKLQEQGFTVTAAVARTMAEGKDMGDMDPPLRVRRDDRIAFVRGMAIGLGNPNKRQQG